MTDEYLIEIELPAARWTWRLRIGCLLIRLGAAVLGRRARLIWRRGPAA